MVNGAIREQSIVCSVRIFGTSGIAPLTLHIQPAGSPIRDRAVRGGSRRGRRDADPGPAQTSYNLYDAYRAATARPCARPTRAGPIVLACDSSAHPRQKSGNGSRSLFVDPALYTVKVRINNNCLLQGMPTRHRYKSCVWSMLCMHYVCITFRVPCSGVGATSGPCGVWPRIRQRLTSCIFARVRDAPPERQGQRDEPSSALRLQKVLRRLALPTKPLASRSMHLTEQSMQRILQQLPWHPPLSPTFQAQPSPRLPWIPSTTRGRS